MTSRRSLIPFSLVLGALAAVACGENGQTPTCPALTLYDVNAAGAATDPKIVAERARAVDAGCMTDLDDAAVSIPDDAATKP